jgi:mRNA interferase MazF
VVGREGYVTLNGERRKAMADQLTTVSKSRLAGLLGILAQSDLDAVGHAIKLHLDLP